MAVKIKGDEGMVKLSDAAANAVYKLVIHHKNLSLDHNEVVIGDGEFLVAIIGNTAAVVKSPDCYALAKWRRRGGFFGFLPVPGELIQAHHERAFKFMTMSNPT